MKDMGISRQIDDLGRVVIPKEIRRNLSIKEGDELELWIDGSTICLKPITTRLTQAQKYVLEAWNNEHPEMQITPNQLIGRD